MKGKPLAMRVRIWPDLAFPQTARIRKQRFREQTPVAGAQLRDKLIGVRSERLADFALTGVCNSPMPTRILSGNQTRPE